MIRLRIPRLGALGWAASLLCLAGLSARAATSETSAQAEKTPAATAPDWSVTLNSSFFDMKGSQAANNDLYSFGDYDVFAQEMKVQYAIAPGWTAMLLGQYLQNSVALDIGKTRYQWNDSGLGDTVVEAVHPLVASGRFGLIADAGVSLPTGTIDAQNPDFPSLHYAYFMQLGSGTFDGVVGLTSVYVASPFKLGSRASAIARAGTNHDGYRLGNVYRYDGWLDLPLKYGFTPRVAGYYRYRGAISGWDPTLPPQPLTEYYYHGQTDWDVAAGLRYEHALWHAISLSAEADLPIFQGMANYDDVVIHTNFYGTLSLNGTF